jgi:hypothetical protein
MMVTTLRQIESLPASYPVIAGLSPEAAAIDPAIIWQRLEHYICWRFAPRACEWIVQGPGEWAPPLKPATIERADIWDHVAETWTAAVPPPSPLGYCLTCARWRFTGTVGQEATGGGFAAGFARDAFAVAADPVPAAVAEAARRLAEYWAGAGEGSGPPTGVIFETIKFESMEVTQRRGANVAAQALFNCGAADLLRPWRGPKWAS